MDQYEIFKKYLKKLIKIVNRLLASNNTGFYSYAKYLPFKLKSIYMETDFVRISTLELMAKEIEENCSNPNYCVAELGVYRGGFAKYINCFFPNRKLYLFDTFEGFNQQDVLEDLNKGYSTTKQDFSKTNIQCVLKKMEHRENCIIRKGFFPETAKGLEEVFCFVSIDADLYQPIYEGLIYFYSRLCNGGCIMIHDFNNINYKGSRVGVKQFCLENKIGYVCLSDVGGSALIVKEL